MSKNIVLATGNQGKVKELARMLAPFELNVVPQTELGVGDVPETGTTFVENAIIKARHAAQVTSMPAIADDSGLAVDALGGAPGVYSARYAGEQASDQDNIDKLLEAMKSTPAEARSARFLCVLVYMRSAEDPTPIICQGEWHGQICLQQAGQQGFGYDPIFWVPEQGKTSAQLAPETKNQLSHRGQALKLLVDKMGSLLA